MKKMKRRQVKQDPRPYCERHVNESQVTWIAANPQGTLAELREFLESVYNEFLAYDPDDFIADHIHELCEAHGYVWDFGDPSDPVSGDDPPTFSYRLGNLDDDITNVEELIEIRGESFVVSGLQCRQELMTGQ